MQQVRAIDIAEEGVLKEYDSFIPNAKPFELTPIETPKNANVTPFSREKKEYSIEEKIAVLVCLKENAYNYTRTSDSTGVTPITIKQWRRDHGHELEKLLRESYYSEMSLLADHLEERQKESKEKYLKAAHVVKMITLNRMAEILPDENNLRFLADTLKVLEEITTESSSESRDKQVTNNFLQMVNNQIITVKDKINHE